MSGFESPNYTQIPNDFFALLPEMGEAELRVVLAICRLTFGYHKEQVRASLTKVMQMTGLSRQGVLDGAALAEQRGLLTRQQDGGVTLWVVNVVDQQNDQSVYLVDQTGQASRPPSIKENLNKKIKETEKEFYEKANKAVDYVLESEGKARKKTHTLLPEQYQSFAEEFTKATEIPYIKKYTFDWMNTFDEWMANGFQPAEVGPAVATCREAGMPINRPGSITWALREARVKKKIQSAEDLEYKTLKKLGYTDTQIREGKVPVEK
jgi:phage replication O-like protein O